MTPERLEEIAARNAGKAKTQERNASAWPLGSEEWKVYAESAARYRDTAAGLLALAEIQRAAAAAKADETETGMPPEISVGEPVLRILATLTAPQEGVTK